MRTEGIRLTKVWLLMAILVIWNATQESKAMEPEATIIRTGVKAQGGDPIDWDVSPDGKLILFNTHKIADGLLLLDVKAQKVSSIPGEPGRHWEMAAWSPDGSQVIAISTAIRDNGYRVGQQEVVLIDPRNWRYRKLAATPGVNILPFFSADGKTVYYFKGEPRDSGATPASRFDLYAYDLASDREVRLTYDLTFGKVYQVRRGHDDGATIMFSAYGIQRMPSIKPNWFRKEEQEGIYVFDKASGQLRHFEVDQGDGFFHLAFGGRDAQGNIYFRAAKLPRGRSLFILFIYRCNPQGRECALLTQAQIDSYVRVAAKTNEAFVSTVQDDGEIVFRRFTQAR